MNYTLNGYMSISLFSIRSVFFGALRPFLKPVSTPLCGSLYLLPVSIHPCGTPTFYLFPHLSVVTPPFTVSTPPCSPPYLLHLRCSDLSFGILSLTSIRRHMVEQGHLCHHTFLLIPCRCGHYTCHRSVPAHCRPTQDHLKASYLLKIIFLVSSWATSHLKNIFMDESHLW